MRKTWLALLISIMIIALAFPSSGLAKTRIVLKSARQASTYYAFAVGQANAINAGAGNVEVTVEDSPGSMVNVVTPSVPTT